MSPTDIVTGGVAVLALTASILTAYRQWREVSLDRRANDRAEESHTEDILDRVRADRDDLITRVGCAEQAARESADTAREVRRRLDEVLRRIEGDTGGEHPGGQAGSPAGRQEDQEYKGDKMGGRRE